MSLMSWEDIDAALKREPLEDRSFVTPLLHDGQAGAASGDVRLGTEFLQVQRTSGADLDPRADDEAATKEMSSASLFRSAKACG
jgi:hypothetical protein